ncbi:MAG: trypsin-like peptidase domain-containing protein, partial [Deltaproteobacteria bacterium]
MEKAELLQLEPNSFVRLAKELNPVVVNISTTQVVKQKPMVPFPEFRSPFEEEDEFRPPGEAPEREFKRQSLGSGFIINKEGYILTNSHVVENAEEIIVTLSDKKEKEYKAKLVGKDVRLDVALIKIDANGDLSVAALGDSDKVEIGEWVVAIGNPFGLVHTVTAGIVSAKGRVIGAGPYDNFIQTDAAINPGNSGGPLFNLKGEVVGINTAIIAGGQGVGFATPINMAKDILLQLKEKGSVTRGWIGVGIQEVTPDLAKSFGLKDKQGALVSSVQEGEPANKAGIKPGDIIVEFDGKEINEVSDLPRTVASITP